MTTSTEQDTPVRGFRRVFGDRDASLGARSSRPLRQRLRLPLMLAGPIVVLIGASWWYLTSGRYVSTDDAYIQAARTMISSDISGRVVAIAVHDNERVTQGQLLFRLDDRPYRIAVEEATAMLAAFAGLGVGMFFLSFAYHYVLWIYLGLSGALYSAIRAHDRRFRVRLRWTELASVAVVDCAVIAVVHVYTRWSLG